MANRRFIDFPIAASVGDNDIVLIWQDGLNKQTTKATLLQGSPSSLAGLTDVDIAALTNGQILQYNSTTSKWENVDRTDINLSELGDVTIVAPTNGQVLVYNSSTSKWENSSGGYVPYTGAVTTVNLGAQSILAGSFVKAGGTSAQFLKADGSVDSSTYGTGTVTSVALTMPTAFSVANSPVTTAGTLAVTATGTTSQYIRGDGSLETFPALTGFVPYTGATADVNLGTHDLAAERGTFANNGSSDTLTVNHTSGSGYGIIVTKGGNNEALYVSKTSGSGNAMSVVGGRTSLVDLALSSVTNTAGDFLTLSGGVVHKRTAAQTLTDIGGQAALTNPVTGTGTSGQVAYFTGTSAISSESNLFWDATNDRLGIGTGIPDFILDVQKAEVVTRLLSTTGTNSSSTRWSNTGGSLYVGIEQSTTGALLTGDSAYAGVIARTGAYPLQFGTNDILRFTITSGGNIGIGTDTPSRKFVVSNGGAEGLEISTGTGSTTIISYNRLTSAFIPLVLQEGTGPVIIGTTSNNGERLQVNGKATSLALDIISSSGVGSSTASGLARFITAGTTTAISVGQANSARRLDIGSQTITVNGEQLNITTSSNHPIIFSTNALERVWITNGGTVGINTATTGFDLTRMASPTATQNCLGLVSTDDSNNGAFIQFRNSSITSIGSITRVGTTNAVLYNTTSDYRLKEDFKEIKGLEVLSSIKVYNFKWKNHESRMDGVLAHELSEVLPYAVYGAKDGIDEDGNDKMQGVDYSKIVPILIKAIQEIKQQFDTFKK
jgi:hypothetical protein